MVVLSLALNMLNFAWEKRLNLGEAGSYFGMLPFTLDCQFDHNQLKDMVEEGNKNRISSREA